MYGLDLFSGIGGLTKALQGYVRPVAYCENDRYAQSVLLSRMWTGDLPWAPISDDVRELRGSDFASAIDIIYGGFPCQDISVAGRGAGLDGQRSGLFFEIARLIGEIRPRFVFLENVAAITVRGSERVVGELCRLGYDTRWGILSAADVGANHRRERWWLLAHARHGSGRDVWAPEARQDAQEEWSGDHDAPGGSSKQSENVADTIGKRRRKDGPRESGSYGADVADAEHEGRNNRRGIKTGRKDNGDWGIASARSDGDIGRLCADSGKSGAGIPDALQPRLEGQWQEPIGAEQEFRNTGHEGWWQSEPNVGRVVDGLPFRVDRLRGLGNAVVPAQAREAFERLMGIKETR